MKYVAIQLNVVADESCAGKKQYSNQSGLRVARQGSFGFRAIFLWSTPSSPGGVKLSEMHSESFRFFLVLALFLGRIFQNENRPEHE